MLRKTFEYLLRKRQRLHRIVELSRPVFIDPTATFNFHANVKIDSFCRIGRHCHIDAEGGVSLGEGTILAPRVTILSSSHDHRQMECLPYGNIDSHKSVSIGCGCWIGWGAMITPGVTIEHGAIVGMGSVVTKDVSIGTIVGGNPAKIIGKRDVDAVNALLAKKLYYLKEVVEKRTLRAGRNNDVLKHLIR